MTPTQQQIDYAGVDWPRILSVVRNEEDLILPPWASGRTHSIRHLLDGLRGRWRWLPGTTNTLQLSGGLAILGMSELPKRYSVAFIGKCNACQGDVIRQTHCQHCRENGIISEVVLVDGAAPDGAYLREPGYTPKPNWADYAIAAHRFDGRTNRMKNRIADGSRAPGAIRKKEEGRIAWGRRLLMAVERYKHGRRGPLPMELQEIQSIGEAMLQRQDNYTRRIPKPRRQESEKAK